MKKINSLKIAAIISAASFTTIAQAQVFSYNNTLGGSPVILTVDVGAGTANYSGSGTNVTYTGGNFSSFDPASPSGSFSFTGVSGTINSGGATLTPVIGSGPARIRFNGVSSTNLWTRAVDPTGTASAFDIPGTFSLIPPTSTSSGGLSSTGGTGSSSSGGSSGGGSSGGTSVPAPGVLGLLGLGLAGLAFGRRRKKS